MKRGIYWGYDDSLRLLDDLNITPTNMVDLFRASSRATSIEYAIRDVVVPATKLEAQGNEIIRLNIGDPLAYAGLETPEHMVSAYKKALDNQDNAETGDRTEVVVGLTLSFG